MKKRLIWGGLAGGLLLAIGGWRLLMLSEAQEPGNAPQAAAVETHSAVDSNPVAVAPERVPCGNVAYAEACLAVAKGEPLTMIFLLATPEAADVLLTAEPSLSLLSRTQRIARCVVPEVALRRWLEQGLFVSGLLGFDVEKPVELYGMVATGGSFVGTAPLQAVSRLDGSGEVVAVIDTGISTGDAATFHQNLLPALYGMTVEPTVTGAAKLTPRDEAWNAHGTHVAGCVVAQVLDSDGQVRGSAPGAALYFQCFKDGNADIFEHCTRSQAVGAKIVNCSWGHTPRVASTACYDTYSREVDDFVWNNPEMLICFAVGNDGCDADGDNVVDAKSIKSSEAYAKNALIVGAQESNRPEDFTTNWVAYESILNGQLLKNDRIAFPNDQENPGMCVFSSRGPLNDGRIAPMIVAPGSLIYSTINPGSSIGAMSGTSMAAPIVSGAAAVFRQYLREVYEIDSPTAALMRAGLILASKTLAPGQFGTGAMQEIPNESPNSVEGWGALRLGEMLKGGESQMEVLGFEDRIRLKQTGEEQIFEVKDLFIGEFSVVLSWIDAPAKTGTKQAVLQNDYDLELISPSGKTYSLGDHTNPIERLTVSVSAAEMGTWTIKVRANRITTDGTGNLAAIAWRAITLDDPRPLPERVQSSETVTLEVSLPEGHRPYLDYPVWPAPGKHTFPVGTAVRVHCGQKLPVSAPPTSLRGWVRKTAWGERERGETHSFWHQFEDDQVLRWYEAFPGSSFYLR